MNGRRYPGERPKIFPIGKVIFFLVFLVCLLALGKTLIATGILQKRFFQRSLMVVDLSKIANTDYLLDAAQAHPPLDSAAPYAELTEAPLLWKGVAFRLPLSYRYGSRWSIFTSCKSPEGTVKLPLIGLPSRNIYLLVAGCQIDVARKVPAVETNVYYTDGSWNRKVLKIKEDLWPDEDVEKSVIIPPGQLIWKGMDGQNVTGIVIPLDPQKTPDRLEFRMLGGEDQPGIIVFSVVQERDHWLAEQPRFFEFKI